MKDPVVIGLGFGICFGFFARGSGYPRVFSKNQTAPEYKPEAVTEVFSYPQHER